MIDPKTVCAEFICHAWKTHMLIIAFGVGVVVTLIGIGILYLIWLYSKR